MTPLTRALVAALVIGAYVGLLMLVVRMKDGPR